MSTPCELVSSRRGSAASCITIQVSTSTLSSSPTCDIEERIAPLELPLATFPSPSPTCSDAREDENPPPYQFPVAPLSSYPTALPFSTLTPLSSLALPPLPLPPPRAHSSITITSSPQIDQFSSPSLSLPLPPPKYDEVPQTLAEKCFVFGFLCPLVWIFGISKFWYSERPLGFREKLQRQDNLGGESVHGCPEEEGEEGRGRGGGGGLTTLVEESLENWRREEKLWSLRCAWCLAGMIGIGLLGGVVIAAVVGKL